MGNAAIRVGIAGIPASGNPRGSGDGGHNPRFVR